MQDDFDQADEADDQAENQKKAEDDIDFDAVLFDVFFVPIHILLGLHAKK